MKRSKRIGSFLLCLLTTFLLPLAANAAGRIDPEQTLTLKVSFLDGKTPVVGASFSIYQIAEADEGGELTATETFQNYFVNIRGKDDEAWKAQAMTLEGYVLRDQIQPLDSGKTDEKGVVSFPTEGKTLTPGLYLVIGERHTQNGMRYDAAPFLVMLPAMNLETNTWLYTVETSVKFESFPTFSSSETVKRKVLKVWKDDGNADQRPSEIRVKLLRDGVVYDTVTLNKENNWRYSWERLSSAYRWTVVEEDVNGYTASVTRDGITFVITNTYGEPSDLPEKNPSSSLPQTGQLWWPVPILLCAGLACVIVGALHFRRLKDEG